MDKILHFLICLFLIIIFGVRLGTLFSIIFSVGKELIDKFVFSGGSVGDLIADLLGIITGVLIKWMIK
jgi:hypothetical protein